MRRSPQDRVGRAAPVLRNRQALAGWVLLRQGREASQVAPAPAGMSAWRRVWRPAAGSRRPAPHCPQHGVSAFAWRTGGRRGRDARRGGNGAWLRPAPPPAAAPQGRWAAAGGGCDASRSVIGVLSVALSDCRAGCTRAGERSAARPSPGRGGSLRDRRDGFQIAVVPDSITGNSAAGRRVWNEAAHRRA